MQSQAISVGSRACWLNQTLGSLLCQRTDQAKPKPAKHLLLVRGVGSCHSQQKFKTSGKDFTWPLLAWATASSPVLSLRECRSEERTAKIQFQFSFPCFAPLTEANFITHLWTYKIPLITKRIVPQTRVPLKPNRTRAKGLWGQPSIRTEML